MSLSYYGENGGHHREREGYGVYWEIAEVLA